jgi:hypothetical protein
MRKAWPVLILAAMVGSPTFVSADKNKTGPPPGGGAKPAATGGHTAQPVTCHPQGVKGHTTINTTNVNVNVNIRVASVMPFAGSHAGARPAQHSTTGAHKTGDPCACKTGTTHPYLTAGVGVSMYVGGVKQTTPGGRATTTNGTPVVMVPGGTGFTNGAMTSRYPTTAGTTTQGSGDLPGSGSVASNAGTFDETPGAVQDERTTDIALRDDGGLLNVRGGAVKLTGQSSKQEANPGVVDAGFVDEARKNGARLQPDPRQDETPQDATQPAAPASQGAVRSSGPEGVPGGPLVPSFLGVVAFGATLLVGWKKFR